jgi:hypothetical protein
MTMPPPPSPDFDHERVDADTVIDGMPAPEKDQPHVPRLFYVIMVLVLWLLAALGTATIFSQVLIYCNRSTPVLERTPHG